MDALTRRRTIATILVFLWVGMGVGSASLILRLGNSLLEIDFETGESRQFSQSGLDSWTVQRSSLSIDSAGGIAYLLGRVDGQSNLSALDLKSGVEVLVELESNAITFIVENCDRVFGIHGAEVFEVSVATGAFTTLGKLDTDSPSSPTADGDSIYVTSLNPSFIGWELHRFDIGEGRAGETNGISFPHQGYFVSSISTTRYGLLLLNDENGGIYDLSYSGLATQLQLGGVYPIGGRPVEELGSGQFFILTANSNVEDFGITKVDPTSDQSEFRSVDISLTDPDSIDLAIYLPSLPRELSAVLLLDKLADGRRRLTIPTIPGQQIWIEFSADLATDGWTDLGDVSVDGDVASFIDSDEQRLAVPRGFYRAVLRPAE